MFKFFGQKTPLERAMDHISQITKGSVSMRPNTSVASANSSNNNSSHDTDREQSSPNPFAKYGGPCTRNGGPTPDFLVDQMTERGRAQLREEAQIQDQKGNHELAQRLRISADNHVWHPSGN